MLEYPNGDEVPVTSVYERLEKHCSQCRKLDHELGDCLEAKAQRKALLVAQGSKARSKDPPEPPRRAHEMALLKANTTLHHHQRREPYQRSSQNRNSNRTSSLIFLYGGSLLEAGVMIAW